MRVRQASCAHKQRCCGELALPAGHLAALTLVHQGGVGVAEGLTRERVRQAIAGALSKLRDDPAVAAYRNLPTG